MNQRTPTARQIAKWLGIVGLAYLALFASLWIYLRNYTSPFREGKKREAESVVQRFHEGYNARQIETVCDEAFACSESTGLREAWDSYLSRLRDRAGPFRAVKTSKIRISIEPFDVRATFVSSFEEGVATESFVLQDTAGPHKNGIPDDGPLKIMSYKVEINGECISTE